MKRFLLAICLLGTLFQARLAAQPTPSDARLAEESVGIIAHLDSLMDLWYIKGTAPARQNRSHNIYGYSIDQVPTFSDSEYTQRIAAIESPLPYVFNNQVKGFINLYAMRKRDQVERMLGLSEYYFPIFEQELDKLGMPHELKYLAVVESALNPRATSRVGATGMWQFMLETGKMYGLNVNSLVDDRRDPHLATVAAAQYLQDMHEYFGDWFLAIASYNCGAGNVMKAIRRSGGKKTFWEIYNYLPAETRSYVPAFIAATYVFEYHKEHNLYPTQTSLPMAADTVLVDRELTFGPIAQVLEVPIDVIRDLNPQYKKDIIPARGKPYTLRLPTTKAWGFCQMKDSIYICYEKTQGNHLTTTYTNSSGQTVTPTTTNQDQVSNDGTQTPVVTVSTVPSTTKVKVHYTVKAGDNLSLIADWYDVSIYSLRRWNGMRNSVVATGKRLTVLVPSNLSTQYSAINGMSSTQRKSLTGKTITEVIIPSAVAPKVATTAKKTTVKKPTASTVKKPAVANSTAVYHTVKKGETLYSISLSTGVSVADLVKNNKLKSQNSLQIGQKIKIK